MSNKPIVLEAVWDSGVTVATDEARNEGGAPQHVGRRAEGPVRVAGRVIEHGHSSSLRHYAVLGQVNGLIQAEIQQEYLLVRDTVHTRRLEACRTQGAVEEKLRASIPHQAVPRQVEIGLDS